MRKNRNYGSICSKVLVDKTAYSKNFINSNLDVWYKYVPKQYNMDPFNCWYAENFRTLPAKLIKKMKDVSSFVNIQNQFGKQDLDMILKNVLKTGTNISTHPSKDYFCLPRTFLIGFPKCGTTLLYKYIKSHPLFTEPRMKECQFWRELVKTNNSRYKELEVLLYLYHFYDASRSIRSQPNKFSIDASASTVFVSSQPLTNVEHDMCVVPLILFRTLPTSNFLIIMRNPVDRLWSDFWYFCHFSKWKNKYNVNSTNNIRSLASEMFHNYTVSAILDFLSCINLGQTQFYCATLAGNVAGEEVACTDVRLGVSIYYVHVQRWLSLFPRKQILLIRMEDLISDSLRTMTQVWSFLAVSSTHTHEVINEKINSNSWTYKNFAMLPQTRNILEIFFYPYNYLLAELLNDTRYLWKRE